MSDTPPITITVVTDPQELARTREIKEQASRNFAWFQAHAQEIYAQHRGKCICIAGERLFVGDTSEEALTRANSLPLEAGRFLFFVPKEKAERIYAHSGVVAAVP